jgi:sec-independent protein translocase protein TatB
VFDIGFSEIVVIGVVALIVIGPERLPKVARTLGHMFGRLQRYVNEVKADINREMELDELRKLQSQVQSAAREIEQSVSHAAQSVESGVRSVEAQLNEAANPAAESPAPPAAPADKAASPTAKRDEEGEARQPTLPGIERI